MKISLKPEKEFEYQYNHEDNSFKNQKIILMNLMKLNNKIDDLRR